MLENSGQMNICLIITDSARKCPYQLALTFSNASYLLLAVHSSIVRNSAV